MTATHCESPLVLGSHTFESRLIVGTGKYATYELMPRLSRRQRRGSRHGRRPPRAADRRAGRNILDFIDLTRYTILPNTAGCFTADDAVRVARLGREILQGLENPGADWVKLEVLGDKKTLLPDPVATLAGDRAARRRGLSGPRATRPTTRSSARRLKEAGATASCRPAARSAAVRASSIRTTSASAWSI